MNKCFLLLLPFVFLLALSSNLTTQTQQTKTRGYPEKNKTVMPFAVYVENNSKHNHFTPSGWMGDYGDIKMDLVCKENPRSGNSCIKIVYNAKSTQGMGWIGIYWQQPPNNWGDAKGGYDLTGAKKLTFYVRGEIGGEKVAEFKVGGIPGDFPDSDTVSIGPIELKKTWVQYSVDLTRRDLRNIIGGFCFVAYKDDNPNGFTMYLDDIIYEE
jgi:hypothetical protein